MFPPRLPEALTAAEAVTVAEGVPAGIDLTVRADGVVVVAPTGELDLATVEALRTALARACRLADDLVLIDLDRVTLLDASTIGVLVATSKQLQARHCRLAVTHPAGIVDRVLSVTRLPQLIPVLRDHAFQADHLAVPAAFHPPHQS
jgi:anti-sigma B factor antagonist